MTELEELEQDAGSLLPTITAILTAAAAYGAAKRTAANAAEALEVAARMQGVATAAAIRLLTTMVRGMRGRVREVAQGVVDIAAEVAVRDAVEIVTAAARAVADGVDPENPTADIPGDSDDPKRVARRTANTLRNSARYHLAKEVEDTAAEDGTKFVFKKTWHSQKDTRVRSSHAFLGSPLYEYHSVRLTEPFITIDGTKLRFPGDPTGPLHEIANCRCWATLTGGIKE